ncbi:MAG: DUF4132 domain-containing protein [Phycisphaerales bacterium]|nr:DUF4132 domain-containing protein [Phycisphaerales bacterium]
MVYDEKLRNQLKGMRVRGWSEKQINSMAKLLRVKPSQLQAVFWLRRNITDERLLRIYNEAEPIAQSLVGDVGRKFWGMVFPKLGERIHEAMERCAGEPYAMCFDHQKPFRAPGHAMTHAMQRARFLVHVSDSLRGLDPDGPDIATWIAHMVDEGDWTLSAGPMLQLLSSIVAGADHESEATREELRMSVRGEHEIGRICGPGVAALLHSPVPEDIELVEGLLLGARRQEGLRDAVLSAIVYAPPDVLSRMLGFLVEHNFARFSSMVGKYNFWFDALWHASASREVHKGLERTHRYFSDEAARNEAIASGEAHEAHAALWALGVADAVDAAAHARTLLSSPSVEHRFIAVETLSALALFPESADALSKRLIEGEPDARVRMRIVLRLAELNLDAADPGLFDALAVVHDQITKKRGKHEPLVWPWTEMSESRRPVVELMMKLSLSGKQPQRMLPYADSLDPWDLREFVRNLVKGKQSKINYSSIVDPKPAKGEIRDFLLRLTQAPSQSVCEIAFEALANTPAEPDEAELLIAKLTRTSSAFRKGAIGRLLKLDDKQALAAATTLLESKNLKQKAAGLEIADELAKAERKRRDALKLIERHRDQLNKTELASQTDKASNSETGQPRFEASNFFGLMGSQTLSPLIEPQYRGARVDTIGARQCIEELCLLFKEHGEKQATYKSRFDGMSKKILSEACLDLPSPSSHDDPKSDARTVLPLADVWLDWLENRRISTRDADDLELVRVWIWSLQYADFLHEVRKHLPGIERWSAERAIGNVADWLLAVQQPSGAVDFVLDLLEDGLSEQKPDRKNPPPEAAFTVSISRSDRATAANWISTHQKITKTKEERARHARLLMYMLRNHRGSIHGDMDLADFAAGYDAGHFNEADFVYYMLAEIVEENKNSNYFGHNWRLRTATSNPPAKDLIDRPPLLELMRRTRERIIEIELGRGEMSGPATEAARSLASSGGTSTLFKLAAALGKDSMVRTYQWGEPTRKYSFSRLIRISWPEQGDTPERFAELQEQHKLSRKRLLEIAAFAPQWARSIEHTLGFPGLEEAVWWIHAHTKGSGDWSQSDLRDRWASLIAERTSVGADDLEEGAVDVAWFGRMFEAIGREGWDELQRPARFASSSGGHKRAQLFASALLGETSAPEIEDRIEHKRDKAAVMALGLVPLPADPEKARAESLRRYKVLQEFKRQSNQFGMQRRASEGKAVAIAMQNLARTAGHRDPQHLEWAMEAEAVRDLAEGPVSVTEGEVTVTLRIDEEGAPELTITKSGKPLKAVPAKLRKHEQISTLRSRVTDLRRQKSRMRLSLEAAMCRGDRFTPRQLREMASHPVLRPMLERLVFVGEGGLIGYPAEGGRVLTTFDGAVEPVGNNDTLRLAHALDLYQRGDWTEWQRDCLRAERVQPFKQIFREIYPPTEAELADEGMVSRYAGHQIQPGKTLALLKSRGWVASHEDGVRRVFLEEGVIAELWAGSMIFTPGWVEDPVVEGVRFCRKGDYQTLPASKVPPRVFSETMRDVDLVVSVAHAGGIDPEASASTVEMRASLLRETASMLGLSNITVEDRYAFIDGGLARYALHLGSANTSIPPGRSLVIVAVPGQHRGRIFLPFADDDPKTAEVMSKALLLARDGEIKDPSILAQIKAKA